ncbi:unnamed protein product, partial [marine sediment metagenome]
EAQTIRVYATMVEFKVSEYEKGGRIALQCVVVGSGEPYATLTINMPEVALEGDEIIVKDYSENTLVAQEAFATGLFEKTGKTVPKSGFPIWRLK